MITAQHGPQPADFADVRATNLAVVLRHVRRHAPCSRADIAAATGLNKATVSSLVADLIERRLVRESGLTEHRIGRPATMLVLDGTAYAGLGVTVAADQVTAVALDLAGEQLLSWRRAVTPGGAGAAKSGATSPGRLTSAVTTVVGRAVNRLTAAGRQVLKLTVGVPGLVDADGTVRLASDLGWTDVDLRGELVRALRKPGYDVVVENDANLAVLAEFRFGAHAATANLVHVTNAAGVGAGIILDGRLVRGGLGYSGELGHITVEPDGPACPCGRRGCLEAVAGAAAIVRHVRPQPDDGAVPDLAAEVEEVVRRARKADRTTLDVLHRAGRQVGRALASTVNLLNPEVIALGGHYVALAPWLLPAAEEELVAGSVAPGAGGCRLVASALGADAAAIGGAARLIDDLDGGLLPRPAGA